ncbi:hypothetical protein [Streptomyces sp. NRRL S-1813]|uniref:hypothetical protein n=1 Tax=Streptomyces sp. NRRL S-1813 TaxID=1463888 RepID=UPI0004C93FF3|nr:hypothetical protein [Streptomyces sp. NRRL S-1813]
MVRNVIGSLIALVGATAAVWSPFRPWYDGRHGSDVRIEDLFNGITRSSAALFGSVVLPMAFAVLLTLIGVALRSRALVTLAGLVVLGFTILWMVRQGQAASELTAGARGLGVGVANALGGGALLLLGALIMRGRGRRVPHHAYDERRYADGRYGPAAPDDRYDERAPYDPHTPYPPGTPEPWDAGRPGAEEWNPEPYSTGPAGPPAGPAAPGGHGSGAYGPREDTPTAPLPVTPPPPPPTQQQWTQPQQQRQQPQQPQQPRPTMPARQQPPTPPVEWAKEHRQPRPAQPQQPGQSGQPDQPGQPDRSEHPEQPPEDRQ